MESFIFNAGMKKESVSDQTKDSPPFGTGSTFQDAPSD